MAHQPICAVLFCMLFMSLACAAAPDAPPRYEISIRAGMPLEEALRELARQTDVQIIFFSDITAGRMAPELSGEYTLAAALTHLLEGSDLTFHQINEHTVGVQQAPPQSARVPTKVQPARKLASGDQLQEVTVIATAEQLVATRVPTPLQEIPQSISVISSEQIREQNSVDLGDVMQNTPGIGIRQENSLDVTAYSRAFGVTSFHVDGGSALRPQLNELTGYEVGNPDLSEFDHVEVLRGSDALFSSNSDPGGTVSLVRKRPLATPSFEMSATLGSWNNYRIELDGTGPLTADGALRARADVVYATRDYFFDQAHLNRKKIFAVLEYDFTSKSTLAVGGSYQWDDALPLFSSIPVYSNGSDAHLPRSTSLTFPWSFYNTSIVNAYTQYRQQFAADWSLKLNASLGRTILDYGYGQFGGSINTVSHSLGLPIAFFSTRPEDDTLGTVDVTLTGKLDWFGLSERIAVGADFMRSRGRQDEADYFSFGPPLTNVAAFDPRMYPDPRTTTMPPTLFGGVKEVLQQYGGFVSLQVDVGHGWLLSSGARVASDRFRADLSAYLGGVLISGSIESSSSHVVQPYNALMYRINDHLSWYASEADIYRTLGQTYLRVDGTPVGPQQGITFESGIKGAWRQGKLNGYLAVYRLEQRDIPIETVAPSTNNPACCFTSGAGRSRGVEIGLDGELAPGWLIGSGYAYNLYATGTNPNYPVESTPRHLLKIWTSTKLSGAFARWTIGGDLRAQTTPPGARVDYCNAQFQNCVLGTDLTTRSYAVVDLRTAYQLSRNWEVALSVNNVLDKRYYVSQETPSLELWYGEPRNFMLRIDAKY